MFIASLKSPLDVPPSPENRHCDARLVTQQERVGRAGGLPHLCADWHTDSEKIACGAH